MPTPLGMDLGAMTPQDAMEAFRARGDLLPSFHWADVYGDEHRRGLAVAGVMRLDLLAAFQRELDAGIAQGLSPEEFSRRILPALAKAGYWGDVEVTDPATGEKRITRFDAERLRLIYDVNQRQSHAAGRWKRIEATKDALPFVSYKTARDERVRAAHRAWEGVTLPVDDPWWNTHYPPCGWRCRCIAFAMSRRMMERRKAAGDPIKTTAPKTRWMAWTNPRTGEITPVPQGIDPGFAHNPGKRRDAEFFGAALRKAAPLRAAPAAGVLAQAVQAAPSLLADHQADYADWLRALAESGKATGGVRLLGAAPAGVAADLEVARAPLPSATLAATDRTLLRALKAGGAPAEAVAQLPALLGRPSAVLVDTQAAAPTWLWVLPGQAGPVVAAVQAAKGGTAADAPVLAMVRGLAPADPAALRGARYKLLWGAL